MAIRIDDVFDLTLETQGEEIGVLFAQMPTKAAVVSSVAGQSATMKQVASLLPDILEVGQHSVAVAGVKVGSYLVAARPIVRETHIRKPKVAATEDVGDLMS